MENPKVLVFSQCMKTIQVFCRTSAILTILCRGQGIWGMYNHGWIYTIVEEYDSFILQEVPNMELASVIWKMWGHDHLPKPQ
jgi:hypothetical protein